MGPQFTIPLIDIRLHHFLGTITFVYQTHWYCQFRMKNKRTRRKRIAPHLSYALVSYVTANPSGSPESVERGAGGNAYDWSISHITDRTLSAHEDKAVNACDRISCEYLHQ